MRGNRRQQTGGAGENFVTGTFKQLGWGVAPNPDRDSDLGTDLFVMARDERLFDLGLVVGVQVKAGESWFREPAFDSKGDLLGWWFRDTDREHIDSWLRHGLPHLIVLHDLNTRVSYWEHIRDEVVTSTGQGAKVLVPKHQTLDDEHRNALLEVAVTLRPRVGWEGSAWTGAASLQPRALLRHALVAPRLVAPHPNAGRARSLTPEQAVALLAQARLRDLEEFAKADAAVPSLAAAADSPHWSWRFVGAFGHRLTTGEVDGLRDMIDDAPNPAARVASTVVAAAGLLQEGRADDAVALLEAALARDEAEPVDNAWLEVQFARACAEVGRVEEARRAAYSVQQIRTTQSEDVTATAIAGVAAALLFETSAWGDEDLEGLITGMDNAVAWWRTQTVTRGLTALADRTFKAWARDTAITLGGTDTVNNQLVAASLTASHLGDHSDWRHLAGLLGQAHLLTLGRDTDPDTMSSRLQTLRLAGEHKELKLTVKRMANDGPATAITRAAADVHLEVATRTTAKSDLTLLQYGGDLLDVETAETSLNWLLETTKDPSTFVTRTNPSYALDTRLLDTIAAVVPAAPLSAQRSIVEHVIALTGQEDQALATSWARIVHALPDHAWDQETVARLSQNAEGHHWALRLPLLGLVSGHDTVVKAQLIHEAREGSSQALAALGDVRELTTGVASDLINGLAARTDQQINEARSGQYGFGGNDHGHALAMLNIWHPDVADWEALFRLLADRAVIGDHKRNAFRVLTASVEQLPDDVRHNLEAIATAVAGQQSPELFSLMGDAKDAAGAATELATALGVLDESATADHILALLAGDTDRRRWAARVAGRRGQPEDVGLLASLALDSDPTVRSAAAAQLAFLVATDHGGATAVNGLRLCLLDPGVLVPASVAATLEQAPSRNQPATDALTELGNHPSARIRSTVARALTSSAAE